MTSSSWPGAWPGILEMESRTRRRTMLSSSSDERVEKNKEERELDWHTTGEVVTSKLWLVRAKIGERYLPHFYIAAESRVEAGYKIQQIIAEAEGWEGRETVEWKSYPAVVHEMSPSSMRYR